MRKLLLLGIILMSGCSTTVPDKSYYKSVPLSELTDPYIIEANDKGEFHDYNQLESLLVDIRGRSKKTHIVIFVHGWHHNANQNDDNLDEFKSFISELRKNGNGHLTIGVYFGWRGEEATGFNYLTLSSRKKISNIVGATALNNVLKNIRNEIKNKDNFKLTVIGHSLGGSVVFNSIINDVANGAFDYSKKYKYIMLNPAFSTLEFDIAKKATTNKRLDLETESPVVIMQSNQDFAVNWLLPIFTGSTSIGFDEENMTHGSWACAEDDSECVETIKVKRAKNGSCVKLIQNNTWYIHTFNDINKYSCTESWKLPFIVIQNAPTISGSHNEILTSSSAKALLDVVGKW